MALPDHYKALGVASTADVDQIKTAYKKLALQYHPDRNPGDVLAEERFKQVSAAYTCLSDPTARRKYDLKRLGLYQTVSKPATHKGQAYNRPRPTRKTQAEINREIQEEFQKEMKRMPGWLRYSIGIVLFFWGAQLIFSHWFRNELNSQDILWLVGGGFLMFIGSLGIFHTRYLQWQEKSTRVVLGFNYINRLALLFLGVVICSVLILYGALTYNRAYHFKYFSQFAIGQVTLIREGNTYIDLSYAFTYNEEVFMSTQRNHPEGFDPTSIPEEIPYVVVEYSAVNPRISRVLGTPGDIKTEEP